KQIADKNQPADESINRLRSMYILYKNLNEMLTNRRLSEDISVLKEKLEKTFEQGPLSIKDIEETNRDFKGPAFAAFNAEFVPAGADVLKTISKMLDSKSQKEAFINAAKKHNESFLRLYRAIIVQAIQTPDETDRENCIKIAKQMYPFFYQPIKSLENKQEGLSRVQDDIPEESAIKKSETRAPKGEPALSEDELIESIKFSAETCRRTKGENAVHWKERRGSIRRLSKLDNLTGISIDGVSAATYIENLLREKIVEENEVDNDVREAAEEGLILFISRNKPGALGELIKKKGEICCLIEEPKTIPWEQRRGIIRGLSKLDNLEGISIDGVSAADYIEELLREKTDKDNEEDENVRGAAEEGLILRDNNTIEKSKILSSNQEEIFKNMMIKDEDKREAVLADGRKALLFKIEQEPGKWNFYYISPEGNGRWCLDKPVDKVTVWDLEAEEREEENKQQIVRVLIKRQRKNRGNKGEIYLEQINVGGAYLAMIREGSKWRVYHVSAQGERKDIAWAVDLVSRWKMSANGAGFVKVIEDGKGRVYHVTAQGEKNDITGEVNSDPSWKMGVNGAGCVIAKDDKIKIYFVSSEGEKETIAESVDEILWTGFSAQEDRFTVYYRINDDIYRRNVNISEGLSASGMGIAKTQSVCFQLQDVEQIIKNARIEEKKEKILSDGSEVVLLKIKYSDNKWNVYHVTPDGNGKSCWDRRVDRITSWDIVPTEAIGGKAPLYKIEVRAKRKGSANVPTNIYMQQGGAGKTASIQQKGAAKETNGVSERKINDLIQQVDELHFYKASKNGARFIGTKTGEKISVCAVSPNDVKEDIINNIDEILWTGFNVAENCFTVYYRIGKNYYRGKIDVHSQPNVETEKLIADIKKHVQWCRENLDNAHMPQRKAHMERISELTGLTKVFLDDGQNLAEYVIKELFEYFVKNGKDREPEWA
ncbi:MAG: hypothetical protein KAJ14_15605, partial [Candidatus Omnitrophica bacterium]|nr:hypothetical protein [Candidatus Omnitrophota bacterium]